MSATNKKNKQIAELDKSEFKNDIDTNLWVSKQKYDTLLSAFNNVLENTTLDVVQRNHYKNLAGIK